MLSVDLLRLYLYATDDSVSTGCKFTSCHLPFSSSPSLSLPTVSSPPASNLGHQQTGISSLSSSGGHQSSPKIVTMVITKQNKSLDISITGGSVSMESGRVMGS